jgi:tetratricopeptide (TPR) repeat protein
VRNATAFLSVLARWCDVGDGGAGPVKKLLATYDETFRLRLPVSEYVRVLMAEGMVAMKEEMLDKAIDDFEIVLKLTDERTGADVLALSNYWIGRCLRKKGNYDRALLHVKGS